MLKYAFYLKLFVLIKHLSAGGEWADLELKMGILFSQIYLTKKCIVAAVYGFEMKCHSVLFTILGLPLFEGRKNYHYPHHVHHFSWFFWASHNGDIIYKYYVSLQKGLWFGQKLAKKHTLNAVW